MQAIKILEEVTTSITTIGTVIGTNAVYKSTRLIHLIEIA